MHEQKNKSPPVFYRTSSSSGPLPKRADLRFRKAGLRSERAEMRLGRHDWGLIGLN